MDRDRAETRPCDSRTAQRILPIQTTDHFSLLTQNSLQPSHQVRLIFRRELTFPNADYSPSRFAQFACDEMITRNIDIELFQPKVDASFWRVTKPASRMSVPKAPINGLNGSLDHALQNAILAGQKLSPLFWQVSCLIELSQYSSGFADNPNEVLGPEPI